MIVGDAHLGGESAEVEEALFRFLDTVPSLGDCLLVNGDLFEFWFAYRRAIPRAGFRMAAALAALARRLPVYMTGGNHDRWGDTFWEQDAGIRFAPHGLRLEAAGRQIFAHHGDGLTEQRSAARLLHRVTGHRVTSQVFRALPVDLGFRLVDRMSRHLADRTRNPEVLDRAALAQRRWAEQRLAQDPELDLVVLGHTHRACLVEASPERWYLNPGAWCEGFRYALVTVAGPELRQFR